MVTENKSTSQTIIAIADKIDQLIAAVLDSKISPKVPFNISLWNTSEIAEYIGVTYKYASEYIVTHHTFPKAMRVPTKNGKTGHPRWYAGEVIEWVETYKEH